MNRNLSTFHPLLKGSIYWPSSKFVLMLHVDSKVSFMRADFFATIRCVQKSDGSNVYIVSTSRRHAGYEKVRYRRDIPYHTLSDALYHLYDSLRDLRELEGYRKCRVRKIQLDPHHHEDIWKVIYNAGYKRDAKRLGNYMGPRRGSIA